MSEQSGGRLWDKGEPINELMHRLTVGDDPILDKNLVCSDALGSAAHARMLQSVGLLDEATTAKLLKGLKGIYEQGLKGEFAIPSALEDVHTAIEARLTEQSGEAGQRIHTGRSRNDQVLLAVRLFLRSTVVEQLDTIVGFATELSSRWEEWKDVSMPGYTHLQPAMPASVGMWIHAFYEGTLEIIRDGLHLLEVLNANPLGSAAGFGVSLPQDRAYVAKLLGFDRVQRSYIDANNSRGRYEQRYLRWIIDLGALLEKFACDVMLFSMEEFRFFSLPVELTTGSSIMPQKRNPDLVELLRGRSAKLRGVEQELAWTTGKLPSSYHRDFQYTKEPVIRGKKEANDILTMALLTLRGLTINKDRLEKALYPELYATYDAYLEVTSGLPFREAYKKTAGRVKDGLLDIPKLRKEFDVIQMRMKGYMREARDEAVELGKSVGQWKGRLEKLPGELF